jgi:hypothetical protein
VTIAYVYHLDAESPDVQSGRPFALLKGIAHGSDGRAACRSLGSTRLFCRVARNLVAKLRGSSYLSDLSFCADATFSSMVDYYPDYTRLVGTAAVFLKGPSGLCGQHNRRFAITVSQQRA